MYTFVCTKCGKVSHSAAPLLWLKNKACPSCGGKLVEANNAPSNNK